MVLKFFGFGRSKKHSSSSNRPYPTVIEELCHPFPLSDLRKATNNFDENNVIGKGFFGKAYKGCLQVDDHVATAVAVKRMGMHSAEFFKNEIDLLCQLRHPNLISLIGFCNHKHEKIIVYEYMSNGSLYDRLFKRDDDDREPLSWKKRLEICLGAARAVHYLHSGARRMVIHRNIKPSNILLDENMLPKLSDFSLSLQGSLSTEKSKPIEGIRVSGTYGYIAPEYAIHGFLTHQCDVYSFGVVLLEVIRAKSHRYFRQEIEVPKIEMSNIGSESSDYDTFHSNVMLKLRAEDIDPTLIGIIAPECYAVYIDIIDRCLKDDWNQRPAMGEVEVLLEHALTLQREADNARDTSSIIQPQQEDVPISN